MSTTRATLMICITALISVALITLNQYHENRYQITPTENGIYIFDHKTSVTNYCDTQQCVMVGQGFISPKSVTITKTMLVPSVSTKPSVMPSPTTVPTQKASEAEQEMPVSYQRSVDAGAYSQERGYSTENLRQARQPVMPAENTSMYTSEPATSLGAQSSLQQNSQNFQEPIQDSESVDYAQQDYGQEDYTQQDYE